VLLAGFTYYYTLRQPSPTSIDSENPLPEKETLQAKNLPEKETPKNPLTKEHQANKRVDLTPEEQKKLEKDNPLAAIFGDIGMTKVRDGNANAQTRSVMEGFRNKHQYPERLTALIKPAPFNKEKYLKNPQKYINTIEPGRVFQAAQPGNDVQRLKSTSSAYQEINQSEWITFTIQTEPGMPVSMTSFDLGLFENQLTATTVKADERGIANIKFSGPPGTFGDVNILASSPVCSGTLRFIVNVKAPKPSK